MDTIILSLLVDNTSGVLSRIAGLFSRRAYNIESLTVGVRMTIVSKGDDRVLHLIVEQLRKQEDVRDIKVLERGNSVVREEILIKVRSDVTNRRDIIAIADIFRANIVDVQKDSLIVELTGGQSKLAALIDMLSGYEIAEIARTGITGLSRGMGDVAFIDDEL